MKNKDIGIGLGILLLTIFIFGVIGGFGGFGMSSSGGMMGGSWGFGMGLGLIFWVIVILAIYYFLSESENGGHEETAMEILKKRFARGEINKEEYEDMEKKLGI
ncbi:hypothetical protein IPdc08_00671 [archaeon]|nr:hypothetical protein IPdc08_00671 [archaeon]